MNLVLRPPLVEAEQPARSDDFLCKRIPTGREFLHANLLARLYALDQAKVGGSKEAQVVTILLVNALETLGNDQAYSCAYLCVWARFA